MTREEISDLKTKITEILKDKDLIPVFFLCKRPDDTNAAITFVPITDELASLVQSCGYTLHLRMEQHRNSAEFEEAFEKAISERYDRKDNERKTDDT